MKRAKQVRSDLAALRNVGPTVERRLNAIGIHSREDLLRIGSAQAYLKMQAQASGTLPVCFYLYSLEGALTDRHWNDLPAATKALLLKSVDRRKMGACGYLPDRERASLKSGRWSLES